MTDPGDERWLIFEIFSLAPSQRFDCGRLLGETLLGHPRFLPTRVGTGDPARTKVSDLPGQLAALVEKQAEDVDARLLLAADEREEYLSAFLTGDPLKGHPPRQVRPTHLELGSGADHEAMVDLFVGLAEVVDPYFGFLTTRAHLLQQRQRFEADRRRVDPSPPTRAMGRTPHVYQEVCIEDVYWVQIFGPAYIDRWGENALDGVGARQHRLRNGGLVLWATENPVYDDAVSVPEGYDWKQPVYDALGPERFARSDQPWGEYGERVPFMTEHAAHVVGWG
jgi:hypothetical protein